jgi:precorrin-6Y C5,15-methyltransferase (decarboxylating)
LSEPRAKITIVGIGDDGLAGLTESARRTVLGADVILGAEATLGLMGAAPGRRVALDPEMTAALRQVREALSARNPVLVNYGDPLFYGVARYLCDRLGKDQFEVVPHVSSMQLAFARVKESWEDAYLTNLTGRPIESVIDRIRTAEKVGLFSSPEAPPARLAQALLDHGIDYFRAYVCENLGQPDERVTQADLPDLVEMDFDPLHVLILVRKPNRPDRAARTGRYRLFGNPMRRSRRACPSASWSRRARSALSPWRNWTCGRRASSGTSAPARARWRSRPRNWPARGRSTRSSPSPGDVALIASNAEAFGVPNVRVVPGRAPEALAPLPDPDAVFVGGHGPPGGIGPEGRLRPPPARRPARPERGGHRQPRRRTQALKDLAGEVHIWNVTVARGIEQMDRVRFQAVNPTFLLAVSKRVEPGD